MKNCYTCKLNKGLQDFPKHNQKKDGLDPNCKQCRRDKANASYKQNSEKIKAKRSEYYYKTKGQFKEKRNEKQKEKLKTDKFFLLSRRLRNRLYYALKNTNWKKDTNFSKYIGCDRDTLIKHIESQFQEGMSWDNRDKWHIDHIIPLASAKTEERLIQLCHYTNLKPMWAKDNIRKSTKIEGVNIKDYLVKEIDNKDAHDFIMNIHYAKRLPPIERTFGLFENGLLVGICTFNKPTGRHVAKYITDLYEKVLELSRLVLLNNKKNEASILISKSIKLLPKDVIVVSFADSAHNHTGYVYQACNFKYYGTTVKRKEMQAAVNVHSSTLAKNPEKYNAKFGDRSTKYRYIYTKDYSLIKLKEQSYPKKRANPKG